jgi:hypothetical protein
MYGKSASSGVESMNRTNKLVHEKTAVDILNASTLLLKMEEERYHNWKEKAWLRELPLTPRGMEHMEQAFQHVNVCEYHLTNNHTDMTWYYCTVAKNTNAAKEYYVRLPKDSYMGSHFGTCSCGFPSKEGLPCKHIGKSVCDPRPNTAQHHASFLEYCALANAVST